MPLQYSMVKTMKQDELHGINTLPISVEKVFGENEYIRKALTRIPGEPALATVNI